MRRLSLIASLFASAAASGCTGVIPAPLTLGDDVELGGWLILDNGIDEPVLLQRREDQAETRTFVDQHGEVVTTFDLKLDGSFSVFTLRPDQLLLLADAREALEIEAPDLSAPSASERLGRCACPAPVYDDRIRFVPGGTCTLDASRGRSVTWDGVSWTESPGAPRDLRLHQGGESCAVEAEELLRSGLGVVSEIVDRFPLKPESAPYERLVTMGDGKLLAFGASGFGVVDHAGLPISWRENPGAYWKLRGVLPLSGGRALAVLGGGPGGLQDVEPIWLTYGLSAQDVSKSRVLISDPEITEFMKHIDPGPVGLAHGLDSEVLVASSTHAIQSLRLGSMAGRLGPSLEGQVELSSFPGGTWMNLRAEARFRFVARPQMQSEAGPDASVEGGDLASRGTSSQLYFPRFDIALLVDEGVQPGEWRIQTHAIQEGAWRLVAERSMAIERDCGQRPPHIYFAMSERGLRGLTADSVEFGLDGQCRVLELGGDIVDAVSSISGRGWSVLREDGQVLMVEWDASTEDTGAVR